MQMKHEFLLNCQLNVFTCIFNFSEIIDHTPRTPIPRSLSYRTLQKHFRLCDVCEFARSGIEVCKFNQFIFLRSCGQILLLVLTVFSTTITQMELFKEQIEIFAESLISKFFFKIVFTFQLSSMSCFM